MKQETILCNHKAKAGTLRAKKYGSVILFLVWLITPALIYAMTLEQ